MSRFLYPLALDLTGRSVLVVGAGPIAARKLTELLRCGAKPLVVAPQADPAVERLVPAIALERRAYVPGDEQGRALVFACTSDAALNRQVAERCAVAGIPCNVADHAEAGSFHVPGVIRKGAVTLTVSTGGSVPGLTRYLKRVLSEAIGDEVADLAGLLSRFRSGLKAAPQGAAQAKDLLEGLPYRKLLDTLRSKGPAAVEAHLESMLHPSVPGAAGQAEASSSSSSPSPSTGHVTLVGAGPGNPKLLTLAAVEALQTAEVIVHDRLIPEETLNLAGPQCLLIPAGKRGHIGVEAGGKGGGESSARQEDIEAHLVEQARQGRKVVRLKGGDPFVFGRGYEEILALEAAGIPWSLIPGVSSVTAGPAWAGIPLTHRGVARSFAVMSGMAYSATNTVVPKADTLILLMGLQRLHEIVPAFVAQGWSPETPAAAVQDATLPDQRVCVSTLARIAADAAARGFDSPTLLVIGDVVALRPKSYFGAP